MTRTLTSRSYQKTKVRWVMFALLITIILLLFTLYAVPGLPGRFGLPLLTTKTSYINPIFDFPDPSILQATDGWYYAYATQGITPEFDYSNIQIARSHDLIHCPA